MNKFRLGIGLLVVVLIGVLAVSMVSAATWSFKVGSIAADGYVAGWGFADKDVTLAAQGYATALCQNNGGKVAPGRNPIYLTVTAGGRFHTDENGKANVYVEAFETLQDVSPSPTPKTAGCPSDNWTVIGLAWHATSWTSASVAIYDSLDGSFLGQSNYACVTTFGADTNGDGVAEATGTTCTEVSSTK